MNPAEALFGFCGWLATRDIETIMSAHHDCVPIVDLIKRFIETNKLAEPRDDWEKNLTHPPVEISV